jgi:hypothetical protein
MPKLLAKQQNGSHAKQWPGLARRKHEMTPSLKDKERPKEQLKEPARIASVPGKLNVRNARLELAKSKAPAMPIDMTKAGPGIS